MPPACWPAPRVRTLPDPVHTLSSRRFEVLALQPRRVRRVDAVSPQAAKLAGAALLGVHASRLVVVELGFTLSGKAIA